MRSAAATLLKAVISIGRWNTTRCCHPPILLVCAAMGVACRSEKFFEPPVEPPVEPAVLTTIELTPAGASILQGGSVSVAVTLTRRDAFTVPANLRVTGWLNGEVELPLPTGVAAVVSNVQSTGSVATATVTLIVSNSTLPRDYSLTVHASGTGVTEATKAFALSVKPSASCPASGGVCEQWAASAIASSGGGSEKATGQPNVAFCDEAQGSYEAWGTLLESNGVHWLELLYDQSVRPTEIHIYEVLGASSIVKVEVKDGGGTYHNVYTAQPEEQACPRVLTIPVTGISALVKVVRLSFEQRALNNYVEIDAVKLIGHP